MLFCRCDGRQASLMDLSARFRYTTFHHRKRSIGHSWRMDETYIRVKGEWRYLYRAVDKSGQTIDFLLTEYRDTEAALRFLTQAIRRHGVPEKITIDGSDTNEAAIKRYNEIHGTHIIIRQVKYLNNMVEQDHRFVKRLVNPGLGFGAFHTAQGTIQGYEAMHRLRKGQIEGIAQGDVLAQNRVINQIFGLAS
jgi:putative transposase